MTDSTRRWLKWSLAGALIFGAIAYLALGDDRGTAILLGIVAILAARVLLRVNPS